MKYTIFCRLGLFCLALSFVMFGCEFPTTYIEIPVPVETPAAGGAGTEGGCECESIDPGESGADYSCCPETPENGCSCPDFPDIPDGCNCPADQTGNQYPVITGFTFRQTNPIRAAYSVRGRTAGRFSDPIGGTPPFSYTLVAEDGIADADNGWFIVSGAFLKIQTDHLPVGVYRVHVGITDSKGVSHTQAETVTVAPDPVVLDQETRTAQGINFKMRYVPSGAFIITEGGEMDSVNTIISTSPGYWIAETEVTQELYQCIMGENPSRFNKNPAPGEIQNRRPVDSIFWHEAILFCNRLSVAAGREVAYHIWGIHDWESYLKWAISVKSNIAAPNVYIDEKANGYRLPSTDEWVWAAMGADTQSPGQINVDGVNKIYSGGPVGSNAGIENFAWISSIASITFSEISHEVGKKLCNELGLFDMTGNVSEWVWGRLRDMGGGKNPLYGGTEGTPSSPLYSHYERIHFRGFRIVSNE
jgi:formylglycine-generating enzyme required for sulfatase activity